MRSFRNPPTRITPYLIEAVRQSSDSELQSEIAMRLGVSTTTVGRIQKRNGFPHFTRQTGRAYARARA